MLYGLLLILAASLISVALVKFTSETSFRSLLPGLITTVFAVFIALAAYLYVFEVPVQCGSRSDFACVVNGNQGVLGLLALAITGIGLWATGLSRFVDQRAAQRTLEQKAARGFRDVVEETRHNLIHVALAFSDDRKMFGQPQLSRTCLDGILATEIRHQLSETATNTLDAMQRNFERFSNQEDAFEAGSEPPKSFRNYIARSMSFLVVALRDHESWCGDVLEGSAYRDFHALAKQSFAFTYDTKSEDRGPQLRAEDCPLLCWWASVKVPGVSVYEAGQRFKDISASHKH